MNTRNKSHLLLLSLLVLVMSFAAPALATDSTADSALAALAQQKASTLVNDLGVTSVQYAVISNGEIILSGNGGVYSRTDDRPITADTMYGIGSTSKVFTTAAIMILVDSGKVALDAPVTEYIPEFTMADSRYRQITVRMLLNHSSGLMGSTFRNAFLCNDPDQAARDMLLADLANQRLKAAPGEFSVYCNDGFTLAELVVERVSGESLTDFIRHNITVPLGMANTATPQDAFDRSRLARTYVDALHGYAVVDTIGVIGTGGIYSTAEDLCRFARIFMNDPGADGADGILSVPSRSAMAASEYAKGIWPVQRCSFVGYGLGWDAVSSYPFDYYGMKAPAKGGDTQLYHSTLLVLPTANVAAAIVSSGGSSALNLMVASELLQQLLESRGILTAARPEVPNGKPVAAVMQPTLLGHSGLYGGEEGLLTVDISADGRLTVTALGEGASRAATYTYTAEGVFVSEDGSAQMSFVTESNGHTYIKRVAFINIPSLGHTVITDYFAQRLQPLALEEDVLNAWRARDGVSYYVVSDKFTSQVYIAGPSLRVSVSKEEPGYVGTLQIVDAHTAASPLQIPGFAGRDLADLVFYEHDGKEYLRMSNSISISEKNMDYLRCEGVSVYTIAPDGYAVWYRIAPADAGRTISVKLPEHGSFALYEDGECREFSWVTGNNTATLPQSGMIVFAGDPGATFEISFGEQH